MALGYACMNRTLRDRTKSIRCNRNMQQATFEDRGLDYASELALENVRDLVRILKWNISHEISFYRCTSHLFPWNSEYSLSELPDWPEISYHLNTAGELITEHDIRFSFHPSHYVKLASDSPDTLSRAIEDLNNHGAWMDVIGLPQTPEYPINIHVGGVYGDKEKTAQRLRDNLELVDSSVRDRLTLENDDRAGGWSISELVREFGDLVPITFDYHHHQFSSELPYRRGFELARETWPCRPVTHYSEPARLWETDQNPVAHSEVVQDLPEWLVRDSDVMLEAGEKERSIFWIRKHRPDLTRINC